MLTIREVIKTFYNALLQRFKKYRGNWKQNDPNADDYIKNRPFYSEFTNVIIKNIVRGQLDEFPLFAVGDTVTVNVDDVEHSLIAYDGDGFAIIGDTYSSINNEEGSLGWQLYIEDGAVWFYSTKSHTINYLGEKIVKLNKKYLPDTIATKSDVETTQTVVEIAQAVADAAQSTANNAQSTANSAKTTANNAQSTANSAKTTANNALSAANSAKTTANSAKTTAENAQSTANNAQTTADNALSAANSAKTEVAQALTVTSSGTISAPIDGMSPGTYQSLLLDAADGYHQSQFAISESAGLQIKVCRDGGISGPQSNPSNPSTVKFIASGASRLRLKGIDELIMNSATTNSTKQFKITVDDSGALTATEVTA